MNPECRADYLQGLSGWNRFAAESSRGDYPVFEMQTGSDSAETTCKLEFGISDLEYIIEDS